MAFAWRAATVTLAGLGYALTLAPELGLGDTAILIDQILRLELSSHVNSHNLTLVTGWLLSHLPFGSTAVRAHLVSWLYGTLGIGLCWLLLRAWRLPAAPAALSALVLAASHSYWWHSTLIESYAANAVMLLAMLLALHRHQHSGETRWLALAAALSGLHVALLHVLLADEGSGEWWPAGTHAPTAESAHVKPAMLARVAAPARLPAGVRAAAGASARSSHRAHASA